MTRHAASIVRLAALWILAGALYKLFAGSPGALPGNVRELAFGAETNFKVAIAGELAAGTLGLLLPWFGWLPLAGALGLFIAVLVDLVRLGAENCGCFGDHGPPPEVMLAIDAALLVAMLAARPWRIPRGAADGRALVLWFPLALVAVAAPFLKFRPTGNLAPAQVVNETGELVWAPPPAESWPPYVAPNVREWIGKPLAQTELGVWFDTSLWPPDATCILWRQSCSHCAAHLRELAQADDGSTFYVLVRIPGDEGEAPAVDLRPMVLPEYDLVWPGPELIVTPPIELAIEGGVVSAVRDDFGEDH